MEIKNTLEQENEELLVQIANAAKEGKSSLVLSLSDKLAKVKSLISRYEQLVREVTEVQLKKPAEVFMDVQKGTHGQLNISYLSSSLYSKSRTEYGPEMRELFLKRLSERGINLKPVKGTIYRTKSDERVGIAVATERQPDRWFLGLPEDGFEHAVLLCHKGDDIIDLQLPKEFFKQYGRNMSRSNGQIKFNVTRRGSGYFVQIPGSDDVDVSEFSNDYLFLR